jgi:hypothetical protein
MNSASAMARLVRPCAASRATRSSVAVSAVGAVVRTPILAGSVRARSAKAAAPIAANSAAAASNAARASRLRRARQIQA